MANADREISMLPALDAVTDETLVPVYQPGAQNPAQSMTGAQFREFAEAAAAEAADRAEAAANRAESAGVQPDWDQNDSEAKDYVKNRPFYTASPGLEDVSVPMEAVSSSGDTWYTSSFFADYAAYHGFRLEKDTNYLVTYDDKEYSCKAFEYTTALEYKSVAIGNPELVAMGPSGTVIPDGAGTDAPFAILGGTEFRSFDGETHYVTIAPSVVKLPNEYLDMDGIKEAIGSTGAVQPDWNQNDATKPDYIKNRPISEAKETVIIEDQTVTTVDEWGEGSCATLSTQEVLEVGKTYMVMFNGTAYECVAYHPVVIDGGTSNTVFSDIVLGNSAYIEGATPGVEHQGTEPFAIIQSTYTIEVYVYVAKDGTYTVKVTEYEVKLNPNYLDMDAIKTALPTMEMVATLEDGTTATYKLYGEVVEQ